MCIYISKEFRHAYQMQGLTDLWQEFDLPGTQRLLDDLATQITTRWCHFRIQITEHVKHVKILVHWNDELTIRWCYYTCETLLIPNA